MQTRAKQIAIKSPAQNLATWRKLRKHDPFAAWAFSRHVTKLYEAKGRADLVVEYLASEYEATVRILSR